MGSVMDFSETEVILESMKLFRDARLTKDHVEIAYMRIRIAEYRLSLLKTVKGKLRSGVKENELKSCLMDIKNAQEALFSMDR